jgi:hypothetical protein
LDQVYAQFDSLGLATVAASRLSDYRRIFDRLEVAMAQKRRPSLAEAELVLATLVESGSSS